MTALFEKTRKNMEKRLVGKLILKENKFHAIMKQSLNRIKELGYEIPAQSYNLSFIDHQNIQNFIAKEWKGPYAKASQDLKKITPAQWEDRGNNWIDTNCFKLAGPAFFAPHIRETISHLVNCCASIHNISDIEKKTVFKYCGGDLVEQLLHATVRYEDGKRPTSKPLIPTKTIQKCDAILCAFGEFDATLNLSASCTRNKLNSKEFHQKMVCIVGKLKNEYESLWKRRRCINVMNGACVSHIANDVVSKWVNGNIFHINSILMEKVDTLSEKEVKMFRKVRQTLMDYSYCSFAIGGFASSNYSNTNNQVTQRTEHNPKNKSVHAPRPFLNGYNSHSGAVAARSSANGVHDGIYPLIVPKLKQKTTPKKRRRMIGDDTNQTSHETHCLSATASSANGTFPPNYGPNMNLFPVANTCDDYKEQYAFAPPPNKKQNVDPFHLPHYNHHSNSNHRQTKNGVGSTQIPIEEFYK